ncbi:HD domain-containing protein [Exilibacterium tricleocarpae]|uniref:HD domain-containing protein n=2 Tax=Exilibacterium tricleocarpae TaxID=2591008 RepID=A0A545TW48_9GAMM|nr:HD domain-containing protein [Exilibacterium tricleocarpae]
MTKGDSLLKHAYAVAEVMAAYACHYGEEPEQWRIAGLLHDADYEAWPDQHPDRIVQVLRAAGEEQIAYAISAHYTRWGVEHRSLLDKALVASDELTGFIVAASLVRPTGIDDMPVKSVKKKLRDKSFAASVDRNEVYAGAALLERELDEHIQFIIDVLKDNKAKLGLA